MAARGNEQPQVSWVNLGAVAAVGALFISAGWIIFQNQFNSAREFNNVEITALRSLIVQMREDAKTHAEEDKHEFERHQTANGVKFEGIRKTFDDRRQEFPTQKEFIGLKESTRDQITVIQQQMLRLEATRPTTGELQATGESAKASAMQLEVRVRSLEDYLRTIRPLAPAAPIVPQR